MIYFEAAVGLLVSGRVHLFLDVPLEVRIKG